MLGRILVRIALITVAFQYMTPYISGVKFHGDWLGAFTCSLVFNLVFWGLECLLAVVVFGVNIGTLGLGALITKTIKFAAALISPSLALVGVWQVFPNVLKFAHPFPDPLIFGFALGGLMWASLPEK